MNTVNIKEEWLLCPTCKSKTRIRLRQDTRLENFPLFCPKCRQECIIEAENLRVTVIKTLKACANHK